jgi:hypothetical protein
MSRVASTPLPAAAALADPIGAYRDDGPPARAIARVLAPLAAPAPLLLLAAAAPLLAAVALEGGGASRGLAGAVLAWAIVLGGASRARPGRPKTRWAEPALLRAIEFVGLIWIASLHGESAYPAVYALLGVLAFRHYDLTYRLRQRGASPAPWVATLAGGWDGRLIVAFALLVAGLLPAGYFAAAAVLGAAFVAEASAAWRRGARDGAPLDDEEDEVQ